MIIRLDLESDTPIYMQLVNQIIEGIARGAIEHGEALPSVRSLASDIGINFHTVNKAYTILKQEGFIQIHRQKGVVVQPKGMPGITDEYRKKLHHQLQPIVAEAICRGMKQDEVKKLIVDLYLDMGGE